MEEAKVDHPIGRLSRHSQANGCPEVSPRPDPVVNAAGQVRVGATVGVEQHLAECREFLGDLMKDPARQSNGRIAALGQLETGGPLQGAFVVPPSGLGLVLPGQRVRLRLDAFPHQRLGAVTGQVRWVGSAGLGSEQQRLHRALIDLEATAVRVYGSDRSLIAGMVGKADIMVGQRTLVGYLTTSLRGVRWRGGA